MLFNSLPFLIFFPIVVLLYFLIPHRYRYIWLLFCSYFFYACQDHSITILLMVSTVITWSTGRLVYNAHGAKSKKLYVAIGFILNLSILIYFKYAGFVLSMFGVGGEINLILPAGISFYTFQSLTYIMDCYRKEVEPEDNILKYALFVSFFPNILSGPIERAKNMLPQFEEKHEFDAIRAKEGLCLMLWGYFLKMVIVSRLSILTELVYGNREFSGLPMLVGLVAYSFQIYCDFAGYSSIAIGAARIMGFNVMRNFRQPYLAISVVDFWRRWHISLSTWFRDYLYIPLGGNRVSVSRKYLNIMIVFVVSGIWHGANLTFVIWGFLFGMYQILGYVCKPLKKKLYDICRLEKYPGLHKMLCIAFTYLLVSLTWLVFRADSFADAVSDLARTFTGYRLSDITNGTIAQLGLGVSNLLFVIFAVVMLIMVDIMCEKRNCDVFELMNTTPVYTRWIIYYMLVVMILLSCNLSTQEFLYQSF